MTPAQIRIVQRTFAKIQPASAQFSTLFYARLFATAPETRSLFRSDLKAQHAKFMKVIAEVVQLQLRALISLPVTAHASGEAVIPGAYWAGKMHEAYGVKSEHYTTMKEALIWALQQSLQAEFTEEAEKAWSEAYDILAESMKKNLDPSAPPEDPTRASRSAGPDMAEQATTALKELGERRISVDD
jgi:hemoglobin-like flavoprotein